MVPGTVSAGGSGEIEFEWTDAKAGGGGAWARSSEWGGDCVPAQAEPGCTHGGGVFGEFSGVEVSQVPKSEAPGAPNICGITHFSPRDVGHPPRLWASGSRFVLDQSPDSRPSGARGTLNCGRVGHPPVNAMNGRQPDILRSGTFRLLTGPPALGCGGAPAFVA